MDASTKDQIFNLIDKSQSILLLTHAKADCDGLGSMISMHQALQALGKEVVAATNDPAPEVLGFLPSINIVQNSISSNNFVITLDIRQTPLNKIKYKLTEDHSKVNIIVTPRGGRFKAEDVTMGQEEKHFDLIITFDTGNLEHLGPIYEQNAELFFNTPVINIDHHASNTDYGQVNYVDVVSASTTEMMLELLREMEGRYQKKFLNSDVATLLLAGLITDTGSFQHANTSPRAMEVAAQLLDLGARQQEIIKNIYKTKKLTTLKLWGTVLSKVETDPIYRLVWSSINKADLAETGATSEESEGIIDDLLSNAPGAEIIMLFKYNEEGYVSVSMRSTTNSADVGKICADMGGGGHIRAAGLKRRDGTSLEKLIEDTLTKVREYQGQRLNIHPEMVRPMAEITIPQKKEEPVKSEVQPVVPSKEGQTVQYLEFKAEQPHQETISPSTPQPPEKPSEPQQVKPTPVSPENKPVQSEKPVQAQVQKKGDKVVQPTPEKRAGRPPKAEEDKSIERLKRDFVSKPKEEKPQTKSEKVKSESGRKGDKTNQTQATSVQTPSSTETNVQTEVKRGPENQQITPEAQAPMTPPPVNEAPASPTPPPMPAETTQDQEIPPAPNE